MAKKGSKHYHGNAKSSFLSQAKWVNYNVRNIVPKVYAALAIALYENLEGSHEEKQDMIDGLFARSQELWNEYGGHQDIVKICEDLTGLEIERGILDAQSEDVNPE